MMLAFGYGISFDVKHLPVYVFDREGSQQSQDLLKQFSGIGVLQGKEGGE